MKSAAALLCFLLSMSPAGAQTPVLSGTPQLKETVPVLNARELEADKAAQEAGKAHREKQHAARKSAKENAVERQKGAPSKTRAGRANKNQKSETPQDAVMKRLLEQIQTGRLSPKTEQPGLIRLSAELLSAWMRPDSKDP